VKFAIPIADGKLTAHFGHCKEFAMVEVEDEKILRTEMLDPPPHEPGVLPRWLKEQGTDVVIAGGMGQRAIELFNQAGVQVFVGAPVDVPEALVKGYLNQTLVTGGNVCDH